MRQRKRRDQPTSQQQQQQEEEEEVLDSDDQERIIHVFEAELDEQHQQINLAFTIFCVSVALLSILTGLWVDKRLPLSSATWADGSWSFPTLLGGSAPWVHTVASAGMHVWTPRVVSRPNLSLKWSLYSPSVVLLLIATMALIDLRHCHRQAIDGLSGGPGEDSDSSSQSIRLHQGLMVGNCLTTVAALALRWDRVKTDDSLRTLMSSTYRHKTL